MKRLDNKNTTQQNPSSTANSLKSIRRWITPAVNPNGPLSGIPSEVLQGVLYPCLSRRNILSLASTCKEMYESLETIATRLLDSMPIIEYGDEDFAKFQEDFALLQDKRLEITLSSIDKVKSLTEILPASDVYITKLDLTAINIDSSEVVASITSLLKKALHLRVLSLGDICKGVSVDLNQWNCLKLEEIQFHDINGTVIFSEKFNKLEKVMITQIAGGNDNKGFDLSLLCCKKLYWSDIYTNNRIIFPKNIEEFEVVDINENAVVDLSPCSNLKKVVGSIGGTVTLATKATACLFSLDNSEKVELDLRQCSCEELIFNFKGEDISGKILLPQGPANNLKRIIVSKGIWANSDDFLTIVGKFDLDRYNKEELTFEELKNSQNLKQLEGAFFDRLLS